MHFKNTNVSKLKRNVATNESLNSNTQCSHTVELQNLPCRCTLYCQKYWHPLLMKGLTILAISMSTNLNVEAYNDIVGNLIL